MAKHNKDPRQFTEDEIREDERAVIAEYLQSIGEPNAASAVLRINREVLK